MEVVELSYSSYKNIFSSDYHIFISAEFCELNKDKAENIYFLAFKDSKYRLGMIVGIRDNTVLSPYSAPFGGFTFIKDEVRINQLEDAIDALELWAREKFFSGLKIILPPEMYGSSFIAKQINVLFRKGYDFLNIDLNYAVKAELITDDYTNYIWRNARKNLAIGLQNQLSFEKCETFDLRQLAYQTIQKNREARGFPLRMTWEQVSATINVIEADFFLCKDSYANIIAAAIIFKVSKDIVQVIYWGDLPEYSENKTMNYLSYKVFEYYKNKNIRIVDIGPSTENSLPNYGLGEFKESIGCFVQPKYSFKKKLCK